MKCMDMVVAILCLPLLVGSAVAESMRLSKGMPCYPTEKTYYDADGVTPMMCKSAGGPAYSFKVYVDDQVIWESQLISTEPAVYFDLPVHSDAEQKSTPRLVFKRDLRSDPTGKTFFFGESHITGFGTMSGGGNTLQVPRVYEVGKSLKVMTTDEDVDLRVGMLPGAVVSTNDYRIIVRRD